MEGAKNCNDKNACSYATIYSFDLYMYNLRKTKFLNSERNFCVFNVKLVRMTSPMNNTTI